MPTKPTMVNTNVNALQSADILNATRNELGGTYADTIPAAIKPGEMLPNGRVATQADAVAQLRGIGEIMMTYQPMQNAFLSALVNRIGRVIITSRLYENPWAGFKKGLMEYGETIEEIFVALAKPYQYDPVVAENNVFKRRIPDVKVAFHSMNYQKFYPTTVSNDQLRQAFLSWQGITDLISRIIEQVYTGANYDEFLVMKYLIAQVALEGGIYSMSIPAVTAENAREVTTTMVTMARDLSFMSNKYNHARVTTYTDPHYLYMILTNKLSAIFDVEVLALSFNMNKAELLGRQVFVDGFGDFDEDRLALIFANDPSYTPFTDEQKTALASIQGLMVDEAWFMIFDNYYNMTEIYNPEGLYWNYFYHVWKTFSVSPFSNAILFTTGKSTVKGVVVTPNNASVYTGSKLQLKAEVAVEGFAPKDVIWTVTGDPTATSTINETGLLTVPIDEVSATLTVKATSVFDNKITGTSEIIVSKAS